MPESNSFRKEVTITADNKTSSAERAAAGTGTRLTTLDPEAGYITITNAYAVAPERTEALLDFLMRATNETIRYVPASFPPTSTLSDHTQWKSREAIAAAREDPKSWLSCANNFESRKVSRP
jgi:hypothetical protein